MTSTTFIQGKKEPLNIIDQDNLNTYFGQNGIGNTLDKDDSELLKINELNPSKLLLNDPTYGLLQLYTNDSFSALKLAGQNIKGIESYKSICVDLVGEAQKSKISLGELCESPISSRSVVKELTGELTAISSDNAFKNIFEDFTEKYSLFKQDLSEINQYILSKFDGLSEDQALSIKQTHESLNEGFNREFKTNFEDLYVSINNDSSKSFQSDFNEHAKAISIQLENALTGQERTPQSVADNSIENTF